jgi:hypothetical protein
VAVTNVAAEQLDAIVRSRPADLPPPLIIGGVDLLRCVAARDREKDDLYEHVILSRISRPGLSWWFNRFRGLELKPEWHEEIARRTAGIPFLARVLDQVLLDRHPGEVNISQGDFHQVLEEYDRRLTVEAQHLVHGDPSDRLNQRELQILQMVVAIAFGNGDAAGKPIKSDLTVDWELYAEYCDGPSLSPSDYIAMFTVQNLGFLPTLANSERQMPLNRFVGISPHDPIVRLLEAAGCWPCKST